MHRRDVVDAKDVSMRLLVAHYDAPLAQLVERQSHNLKVASSILAGSKSLSFTTFVCSFAFVLLTVQ